MSRNFEEYRAEVLEQLGATAVDLRNEPLWRAKVLEALGAEYTDEDTRNFERYRLKVLENLSGGGSGGGGSSDFSTAEVTVSGLSEGELLEINTLEEIDGKYYLLGIGNGTSNVLLYQGSISGYVMYPMADITLTENATKEDANGDTIVTITGDCTITIS